MPILEYWLKFLQGSGISQISQPVTQNPAGRDISDALQDVATVSQTFSDFEILQYLSQTSSEFEILSDILTQFASEVAFNSNGKQSDKKVKLDETDSKNLRWCQL